MRLATLLPVLLAFSSLFGQKMQLEEVLLFENLKVNPGFPPADNMICEWNGTIYLMHNAKRPWGLDYDSLILFGVKEGKLHFVQNLYTPELLDVSFIRSFSVNDSTLYFTDNNGVYLYKKEGSLFQLNNYVHADNTYDRFNQKFGRFEAWHSTQSGIYTTDFHIDNETYGGCKWMHINQISNRSVTLLKTDSIYLCGNHLSTRNNAYPLAFNPSGNTMAVIDIPTYTLKLFAIQDSFRINQEFDISSYYEKKLNADSIKQWSSNIEKRIDYNHNNSSLSRHYLRQSVINRILFTSDSTLLILGNNDGFQFLEMNLQNGRISKINLEEEHKTYSWFSYTLISSDNFIYLLTPNAISVQDGFNTKTELKGWKLAKLRIDNSE